MGALGQLAQQDSAVQHERRITQKINERDRREIESNSREIESN
jgi:hypothetical protein